MHASLIGGYVMDQSLEVSRSRDRRISKAHGSSQGLLIKHEGRRARKMLGWIAAD